MCSHAKTTGTVSSRLTKKRKANKHSDNMKTPSRIILMSYGLASHKHRYHVEGGKNGIMYSRTNFCVQLMILEIYLPGCKRNENARDKKE